MADPNYSMTPSAAFMGQQSRPVGAGFTGGPPPATPGGGGGGGGSLQFADPGPHAGTLFQMGTKGYGSMPESASPYSQSLQGAASNARWNNLKLAGPTGAGDWAERMAEQANQRYQRGQEEFQGGMQGQQLQAVVLKNQALQKLISMFGGQGGENPAEGFLASLRSGGVQGLADSPLMQKLLAGHQAQVESAFNDPGGLRSQMQRLGTTQNRYSADSVMAAQRQAALERQKGLAGSQAYGQAWQGTLAGLEPMLRSAGITSQFASSQQGQQAQQLPQLLSAVVR